jgi:sigma-B regulation protein RsbU (phosphoserine phosphatase)
MLGAFARWTCKESAVDLRRGDTLIVYSDGVTEAGIERGEDFGEDRLIETLRALQGQTAAEIVKGINDAVSRYSGASRTDDVTVVALRAI